VDSLEETAVSTAHEKESQGVGQTETEGEEKWI